MPSFIPRYQSRPSDSTVPLFFFPYRPPSYRIDSGCKSIHEANRPTRVSLGSCLQSMNGLHRAIKAQNSRWSFFVLATTTLSPSLPLSPSYTTMSLTAPSPLTAEMESTSTSSRAFPPSSNPSTSTSPQPLLHQSAVRSNPISSPTSATTTLQQEPPSSPTTSSHGHLDSEEEIEVEDESGKKVKKKRKEIVLQDQTNLLPVKQVSLGISSLYLLSIERARGGGGGRESALSFGGKERKV